MKLGKFKKDPDEKKRYSIDYTDWLDTAETVSSVTPSVELDYGSEDPITLEVTSIALTGDSKGVTFFVEGGIDDVDYKLTMTMTSSAGQIKEDHLIVSCVED